MVNNPTIRDTVLRSLSAIGGVQEASYYADMFAAQQAERFALIVIDPRCLKNPLLESLISDLRILSDLDLYPVLLVGALDDDRTTVKFQAQRLAKELGAVSIRTTKLNTATYGLISDVKKASQGGAIPIMEMTERRGDMDLERIVTEIQPNKIIFLQPSGGLTKNGIRIPVVNLDNVDTLIDRSTLTTGQTRFMDLVGELSKETSRRSVYIIASPLNLLTELFTTKGSGTLFRRGAQLSSHISLKTLDADRLAESISRAFGKSIRPEVLEDKIHGAIVEVDYRGGAICTKLGGMPYLSKFWVSRSAQGEGIARDIWEQLCEETPRFFWRSRKENPFNDWYMYACDGMQVNGEWRIFWKGLKGDKITAAIKAASKAPDDFLPGSSQ